MRLGLGSGEDFDRVAVWIVKDNIHRFTAGGFRRWNLHSSGLQVREASFEITYRYHDEPTAGALSVSDDVYQTCGRHLPNSLVLVGDNVRRTTEELLVPCAGRREVRDRDADEYVRDQGACGHTGREGYRAIWLQVGTSTVGSSDL